MTGYHLAQFNIGRAHVPLDDEAIAEFVRALGPINELAELSPGFVWRLVDESGQSSSYVEVPEIDDPLMLVNYSIWTDLESLRHFVHKSGHMSYLRRRGEWFEPATEATSVCWWIAEGEIPSVSEAYAALMALRSDGPSQKGWPMNQALDPPG
ncbi:MAG: DUF3291 domain-containing protein [Acidimicrobiales bacterium]